MRMFVVIAAISAAGFFFTGCATKGYVQDEVLRSQTQLDESIKSLNGKVEKLDNDAAKRMSNIETTYALKSAVEADSYNREQKLMKEIATQIYELKKSIKVLESMKEASVDKLSQSLQSSVYIFMKQLKGQRDGLEAAIEELERLLTSPMIPPTNAPEPSNPSAPK